MTTREHSLPFAYSNKGAGFVEDIVFPNGKVLFVPAIPKSNRGGWYYHPIMKQRNGKKVVLGRSEVGLKAASDAMLHLLNIAYDSGDWAIPTIFSPTIQEHDVNNATVLGTRGAAAVTLPATFGSIRFGIGPKNHYQTAGEWLVEMSIPTAVLTAITKTMPYNLGKICDSISYTVTAEEAEDCVDSLLALGPIEAFALFFTGRKIEKDFGVDQSPVKVKGNRVAEWLRTIKFHMPYDEKHFRECKNEYNGLTISSDEEDPETGRPMYTSTYLISDTVLALSATWRQAYISEDAVDAFSHLSTIFAASDVVFSLETTRKYDANTRESRFFVKQLSVQIPEGGQHNRGGHTFVITPDDFKVTSCGYVSDEENFIDDAKRQALADIQTLVD